MMKKIRNIQNWITILCCVGAITACSEADNLIPEAESNIPETESQIPIAFQAEDNWGDAPESKASRATFEGNNFGVYADYIPADGDPQEFMVNQLVEREAADVPWTYSPIKYWPTMTGDKLDFYAYYPYDNGEKIKFEGETLTYSPCDGKTDLLMAEAKGQTFRTNNGTVSFNFSHQLARIDFKLHNGWSSNTAIGVSFVKFSGTLYKTVEVNVKDQTQVPKDSETLAFIGDVIALSNPIEYNDTKTYTPVGGNILVVPFPKGSDDKTTPMTGTIELGIDFYTKTNDEWVKQTPSPSYVAKASVSNVVLEKEGITTFQVSFGGPKAGIQVVLAQETTGWTQITNDNNI